MTKIDPKLDRAWDRFARGVDFTQMGYLPAKLNPKIWVRKEFKGRLDTYDNDI